MKTTLGLKICKMGIFFLLLILSKSGFSQKTDWVDVFDQRSGSFYEVRKDFANSWKERKVTKGKGYKVFKRWEAYMEPRVFPSGDLTLPSTTYGNYMEWQKSSNLRMQDGNGTVNTFSTANWTQLGPIGKPSTPEYQRTGAGRINFLRFLPGNNNTLFAGAPDGGLWKSTNGGSSWTTNTDFLTVIGCSDLAIDPNNTNIMYLATGDIAGDRRSIGVLKSTDGGLTWNATGLSWAASQGYRISRMLMDPSNSSVLLVATNGGIFRTTNGGTNWSHVRCCDIYKDMEFKPGDPNTVYAGGSTFWKSTNNGASWTQITTGLPSSNVQRIAIGVSAADPSVVYALLGRADDQGFLGMYVSTNSGTSFSLRSSTPNILGYETDGSDAGGQAFYDLAITVSPTNANLVTTGGINQWQSSDGGINWDCKTYWYGDGITTPPFVHADVHDLVYLPGSSTTLFSCNDGGIFKSTDNGTTWTDISNNLSIAQQTEIGLSQTSSSLYIAGHQDNGTNLHSGSSWENIYGGDGGDCFISHGSNDTIYFSYISGDFHRSDDGGLTENTITTGLSGSFDFYSKWYQDPVKSSHLWAAGNDYLFKSTNKGNNWTQLDFGYGSGTIQAIAVAPSNTNIVYAINADAVSKSINGGALFSSDVTGTLPVGSAALTDIVVSNTNPDKIWVCFSGYSSGNKVFKSTNGGVTWVNISSGLPNLPFNSLVYVNNSGADAVYVGGDIGVYYIDNNHSSWQPFFTNLPNVAVRDLEIQYATGKVRAGTYGRGTWESPLFVPVTANATAVSSILCPGNTTSITVGATGGTPPYSGTGVFSNVGVGTHSYTVTDANSNTSSVSITISAAGAYGFGVVPSVSNNTQATAEINDCNPNYTVYWRRNVANSVWSSVSTSSNTPVLSGLIPATAYMAYVVNSLNQVSPIVNFVTSGTPVCGTAPTGLTASVNCNQITASWNASGYPGFTSYFRQITPSLMSGSGGVTTTTSRTLTIPASSYGQQFEISVAGKCGTQYSIYSNPVYASVPDPRPAQPTNLTFSGVTCSAIPVSWNAVPGAIGYRVVVKNPSSNSILSNIFTTNTNYTRSGVAANYTYEVWVIAIGCNNLKGGESQHFNVQTCTGNTSPTGVPRLLNTELEEYDDLQSFEMDEVTLNTEMFVYPNPANQNISVMLNHQFTENPLLTISNVYGQIVYAEILNCETKEIIKEINLLPFTEGIYIINVSGNGKELVQKFLKINP